MEKKAGKKCKKAEVDRERVSTITGGFCGAIVPRVSSFKVPLEITYPLTDSIDMS